MCCPPHVQLTFRDALFRLKSPQEQLKLLGTVLDAAANAIVITDRNGTIIWVNQAFSQLTGYSAGEAVGQTPRLLRSDRHDQAFYQKLWKTIGAGETWEGEITNRRKDGSLYTEQMTITPVLSSDRSAIEYFIAIKQDVTQRKQLENHLRQLQTFEAIGTLAGGIAHDFNNLMMVIASYSELLLEQVAGDEQGAHYVEQIKKATDSATVVVNQLLAFSRQQVQQKIVLDLNSVAGSLEDMLRRLLPEDIVLSVRQFPGVYPVLADRHQLEQVIMNLATNARDAMPQGGQLALEIGNQLVDELYLQKRSMVQPGPYAVLTVSDTGIGMTPEVQEKIFEPFFTTKAMGKGTGLGLATVYGIVKQSRGYVWVYSEVGKGTTFKIYLPAATGDYTRQGEAQAIEATDEAVDGKTILLVEDEGDLRVVGVEYLSLQGYKIVEASNGQEALDILKAAPGEFDFLITDLVMPGAVTGLQLAREVRSLNPRLSVVCMSGYFDRAKTEELEAEGVAFLQKPFSFKQLTEVLRSRPPAAGDDAAQSSR